MCFVVIEVIFFNLKNAFQVTSNVLKVATKLMQELGKPTKISGLAMNKGFYNVLGPRRPAGHLASVAEDHCEKGRGLGLGLKAGNGGGPGHTGHMEAGPVADARCGALRALRGALGAAGL